MADRYRAGDSQAAVSPDPVPRLWHLSGLVILLGLQPSPGVGLCGVPTFDRGADASNDDDLRRVLVRHPTPARGGRRWSGGADRHARAGTGRWPIRAGPGRGGRYGSARLDEHRSHFEPQRLRAAFLGGLGLVGDPRVEYQRFEILAGLWGGGGSGTSEQARHAFLRFWNSRRAAADAAAQGIFGAEPVARRRYCRADLSAEHSLGNRAAVAHS